PELVGRVAALEAAMARLDAEKACSPSNRSPTRFMDNADGTVTDPCSGLLWSKTHVDLNGDSQFDDADLLTWDAAMSSIGAVTLGGHSDWRLPTLEELDTLPSCLGCDPRTSWPNETPFRWFGKYSCGATCTTLLGALSWTPQASAPDPALAWRTQIDDTGDSGS